MRIVKTAWSSKRRNNLVNFYAMEPDKKGKVMVLNPPFSWASNEDALAQINLENDSAGKPQYKGRLLHVVLDMASGRLYLPNFEEKAEIAETPNLTAMLDAIKIKIEQLVDFVPLAPLIRGDPLNTVRIRRIADFKSVADFIRKQVSAPEEYEKDIAVPVVEADLTLMPITAKALFGNGSNSITKQWAYITGGKVVDFIINDEIGGQTKDVLVCQQKPPFILINTASQARVSDADKERCVVMGYKEYAAEHRPNHAESHLSTEVQTFKYLMYIGWSFKELSLYIYSGKNINDFYSMLYAGSFLYNAAKTLEADGYPNPASNPFYYTLKVDANKFPIKFSPQAGVDVFDYSRQPEIFRIVYFDPKSSCMTFKTPLYLPDDVLTGVFNPQSTVMISQYDNTSKTICSETNSDEMDAMSPPSINAIQKDIAQTNGREGDKIEITERAELDKVFERKHISDYPQVSEIIKDLCKKLAKKPDKEARAVPTEIKFDDLEVVVGPWSKVPGYEGARGGYYTLEAIKKATGGKSEFEPILGMKVTAPVIVLDNMQNKTVGERTSTIIHEYRHHINVQLWVDSPSYDNPAHAKNEEDQIASQIKYLSSPQERLAHKTQFKYMLSTGITKEQILRERLGRKPTIKDVPVVKEYLSIINEAVKELAEEKDEEEQLETVKSEAKKHVDTFDPSTFNFDSDDSPPFG